MACWKGWKLAVTFLFYGVRIELGGNMPFLWRRDQTWQIKAGTSDTMAFPALDPFNVSINSVSKRLVVVAVPGTNGKESSWGNH